MFLKMRQLPAKSSLECAKFMLIGVNVMFLIVGFVLMSLGVTIKTIFSQFDTFMANNYYNLSKSAIGIGIVVVLISIFGCFAAIKRSVCLVNVYALALVGIFFSNLTLSLAVLIMMGNLEKAVEIDMVTSMTKYDKDTGFIWNAIQSRFHCCGIHDPQDWTFYKQWFNLTSIPSQDKNLTYPYFVPDSCCTENICTNENSLYKLGCFDTVISIVMECFSLLGIGSLCVAAIEFLGIIFALLLAKTIRQLKTRIEMEKIVRRQHLYQQLASSSSPTQVCPVLPIISSSEA